VPPLYVMWRVAGYDCTTTGAGFQENYAREVETPIDIECEGDSPSYS